MKNLKGKRIICCKIEQTMRENPEYPVVYYEKDVLEVVAELRERIKRRIKDLSTGDSVDIIAKIELEELLKHIDELFGCEKPTDVKEEE